MGKGKPDSGGRASVWAGPTQHSSDLLILTDFWPSDPPRPPEAHLPSIFPTLRLAGPLSTLTRG